MRTELLLVAVALVSAAAACDGGAAAEPPTFEAVVEKVLTPQCTFGACHVGSTPAAHLDLTPEHACDELLRKPSSLCPERALVVPGLPEDSFLLQKLTGRGLDQLLIDPSCSSKANASMPLGGERLDDAELALVHDWIVAGAPCRGSGELPASAGPAIDSFTVDRLAPRAGESVTFTVTLDEAAPEGDQQIKLETPTSALATPTYVTVPAGQKTRQFDAYALRPASRFALRAHIGQSAKEIVLRIAGLEVAEVLSGPIEKDGPLPWVKLYNRSSMPIDLGDYQLKAGQSDYDLLTVDLAGTLQPRGCAVIGALVPPGPRGEPSISQEITFAPDLPHRGEQAAGFALFDRTASPVGGVPTPVDTMLVGLTNRARLLGPDAEVADPYCDPPASGMSALRTGPSTCVEAQAQPSTCF